MATKRAIAPQSKTKCDIVVEEILAMITRGEYKENEKLPPEHYFVDYFGYSRVTIRESFKKLNTLGVVTIKQGGGTFVNRVDLGTMMKPLFASIVMDNLNLNQIYSSRLYVESGTVRLAARNRTDKDMEALEEILEEMRVVVGKRDTYQFNKLDMLFHEMIADAAQNPIMSSTYKTIKDVMKNYITHSNLSIEIVENSLLHHKEIVQAIKDQDEERARLAMENHVERTKEALIRKLQREGIPNYLHVEN